MNKLTSRKDVNRLALLFSMIYMVSYLTRINYGAIVSEIELSTSIPKDLLSLSIMGSSITYGIGQVFSGVFGDKFSPKKVITCGFLITTVMNLIMPICQNHIQMIVVWGINGFAQAFMWPPLVKMMTLLLSGDDYKDVVTKVSWGSSFGTIVVYLVAPLIISVLSWKYVFVFSSICAVILLFVWQKFNYSFETNSSENKITNDNKISLKIIFAPIMVGVMFLIIVQGMLRDGVTTWMPTYISETYNLGTNISILSGILLPIFSIFCYRFAQILNRRRFKNPIICAGVFYAASVLASLLLLVTSGKNSAISVLCSAILAGCMHGINLMLICMIPPFFAKYGKVSTVSGILNSCTYVGSAISTYGVSVLAKNIGWTFNLAIWLGLTVIGMVLSFIFAKIWENRFAKGEL